jgi:hypothetical protein
MTLLIAKLRLLPKIWLFALTAFLSAITTTGAAQNLSNPMVGKTLTTVFTYPNFSDIAGLTLNGNAEKAGSVLLVGPAAFDQIGSAYYTTQVNVGQGFATTFTLNMKPASGSSTTADGMSFIIQNSSVNALGTSTGQPGYDGIPDSLAVEFDTFYNPQIFDPNNNHVGIQSCGTAPNSFDHQGTCDLGLQPTLPVTLADGNPHKVQISYLPHTNGVGTFSIEIDSQHVLSIGVNLATLLSLNGNDAWVGFTAGSGADFEYGTVRNWTFATVGSALAK